MAVLIFLAACGLSEEEKRRATVVERKRLQKETVAALKIAVMPTLDCLPLYVAKDLCLFDTLHVDVRLRPFTAQMDCDTAIAGGSVEGMVSDLIRTERLKKKGTPLYYLSSTNVYWQLISNKNARLKQLNQLGDKMVAMTRFSATDYLTDQALAGVKTKAQAFKIQINDVHVRLHMLLNNEMDAMWLAEPQATTARLNRHPLMMGSDSLKTKLGILAFRQKILGSRRRKEQLALFTKAYNMAVDSINQKGLKHYSPIIKKYCCTDDKTVQALPRILFDPITKPSASNVESILPYVQKL